MTELPHPYDKLSWTTPEAERQAAIAALMADPDRIDFRLLLRPSGRKDVWEHAAEVLRQFGFPRLAEHLPSLLEWLQDLNWPGAQDVLDLLGQADPAVVEPELREAMVKARSEGDEDWLTNLQRLAGEMARNV